MASVQDRLKLKRESCDTWSTREQLCLASSVLKSGDQNWISVSRSLKPFAEKEALRPPDWFSQKSCAIQYAILLENVDTPKRKKRESGETSGESIVRRLTQERITELGQILAFQRDEYQQLKHDVNLLRSGNISDEKLQKMWQAIEQEEREAEQKARAHSAWLAKRQQKCSDSPQSSSRKSLEGPAEAPELQELQPETEEDRKNRGGRSPLLTSLLKSPSPTTQMQNPPSTAQATSPTIASLLGANSKPPAPQISTSSAPQISTAVTPQLHHFITSTLTSSGPERPSVGAPTLSMLLELPSNLPRVQPSNLQSQTSAPNSGQNSLPDPARPKLSNHVESPMTSSQVPVDDNMVQIIDHIDDVIGKDKLPEVIDKDEINEIIGDIEELIKEEITKSPGEGSGIIEGISVPVGEEKGGRDGDEAPSGSPRDEVEEIDQKAASIAEIIGSGIEGEKRTDGEKRTEGEKETEGEGRGEEESVEMKDKEEEKEDEREEEKCEKVEESSEEKNEPDEVEEGSKEEEKSPEADPEGEGEEKMEEDKNEEEEEKGTEEREEGEPEESRKCDEDKTEEDEKEGKEEGEGVEEKAEPAEDSKEPAKESEEEQGEDRVEPEQEPKESEEKPDAVEENQEEKSETSEKPEKSEEVQDSGDPPEVAESDPKEKSPDPEEKKEPEECKEAQEDPKSPEDPNEKAQEVKEDEPKGPEEQSPKTDLEEELEAPVLPSELEELPLDKKETEENEEEAEEEVPDKIKTEKEEGKGEDEEKPAPMRDPSKDEIEDEKEKAVKPEEEDKPEEKVEKEEKDEKDEIKKEDGEIKKEETSAADDTDVEEEESSLAKLPAGRAMKTYSKKQNAVVDSEPETDTSDTAEYKIWKKSILLHYSRLATHKYASLFLRPITEDQAPGYHSVVFRPMDLSTIKKNIDNGTIRTNMQFQRDVMLMFQNAIMYNKSDSFVYKMAVSMQEECLQSMQILVEATGEGAFRRETRTAASSSSETSDSSSIKRKRSLVTPSPLDTDSPRMKKRRKSEND